MFRAVFKTLKMGKYDKYNRGYVSHAFILVPSELQLGQEPIERWLRRNKSHNE